MYEAYILPLCYCILYNFVIVNMRAINAPFDFHFEKENARAHL